MNNRGILYRSRIRTCSGKVHYGVQFRVEKVKDRLIFDFLRRFFCFILGIQFSLRWKYNFGHRILIEIRVYPYRNQGYSDQSRLISVHSTKVAIRCIWIISFVLDFYVGFTYCSLLLFNLMNGLADLFILRHSLTFFSVSHPSPSLSHQVLSILQEAPTGDEEVWRLVITQHSRHSSQTILLQQILEG